MGNQLNLSFISLYRLGGQEWPLLPGLMVMNPPRRTARGRESDRLVIYLNLAGSIRFTTAEYVEITRQMGERFYQATGSLTNALKTTAESVNAFILERNLRLTGSGQSITGLLVMGALRKKTFSFAMSGPTHVFWMSERGTKHFYDRQIAGRGLGFMHTVRLHFAQVELRPGDRMVFGVQIADNWAGDLLADRASASVDVTRRRLMATSAANLNAVLIQAQTGNGEMIVLKPAKQEMPAEAAPAAQPPSAPQTGAQRPLQQSPPASHALRRPVDPSKQASPQPSPPSPTTRSATTANVPQRPARTLPSSETTAPPGPLASRPPVRPPSSTGVPGHPSSTISSAGPGRSVAVQPQPSAREDSSPEPKELVRPTGPSRSQKTFMALAHVIKAVRGLGQKISHGVQVMIPRLLPTAHEEEQRAALPPGTMMAIAIAVPLVVVTIAAVVYWEIGVRQQFEVYYTQAEQAAIQTVGQTDPAEVRRAWETTLYWLGKAETYQQTSQSRALRRQAQLSLDTLDRIIRLDFKPAIAGGLSRNVQITRMAASDTEVFMLNRVRGNVMRVFLTGSGYDLDPDFRCEPGLYNGIQVGSLIDIITLPRTNSLGAVVAGIDANGTLLYCIPNGTPQASPLAPPDTNWNKITAIKLDNNNLYVLDAPANAVWTYIGDQGMFPERPTFFFGPQVPQMSDVVDLAVNADDLYLLHSDGHLSYCTLSRLNVAPTRCIDPVVLTDSRPGHQSGATLPDAVFTQITFTAPPDSSVTLLEPHTQAVYRFSPRVLELQSQLRAYPGNEDPLPAGPVSAMTIAPTQMLFLFVDGQLYYASTAP